MMFRSTITTWRNLIADDLDRLAWRLRRRHHRPQLAHRINHIAARIRPKAGTITVVLRADTTKFDQALRPNPRRRRQP